MVIWFISTPSGLLRLFSVMLTWFVDIADCAVQGGTIICTSQAKRLVGSSAVNDENVCIYIIRKYFSSEAWSVVRAVVNAAKHDPLFYCGSCMQALNDDEQSIACDSCLQWRHFCCIQATPKARCWYCAECKRQ